MLFSHPQMLWGLLAVLVPVIIHLFNFRRYRKVYFSNVDALVELHNESRRQSNVRRWLVLLCRVLAVAMVVLAFAGPVIPGPQSEMRSGTTAVSVYIDNSFSMEAASPDGTLLATACDKARQVAAAYGPADRYQLLTADMAGSQMRWLSRDEFLTALDDVQPSPAVRRLDDAVRRQLAFLAQSAAANRHAFVISDFQRSTSPLAALPADSAALVTLVPLAAAATDNVYVDTLVLDAPACFAGAAVTVDATLANAGSHDAEKIPVRLVLDGTERALATVDIPAGTSVSASLRFTIPTDGWHQGYVKIDDYPVVHDDSYFFALFAGGDIGVLEVGPSPSQSLRRLYDIDSTVAFRTSPRLSQHEAQQASFIIIDALRQLPSGDAQWLAQWVADGGSLLVIPPADADVADLNALLAALQAPRLGRWVARRSTASTIDVDNSLFRSVFAAHSDEMEMPTVQGHYELDAQAVRQSVITLADGTDLLAVTPVGEGRVYLFSTPLEQTDFPQQALFVPTLYNMALFSRPVPPVCHTLGSTEPIVLQGRYNLEGSLPELADAQGQTVIPDIRNVGGRQLVVPHGEIQQAGVYTLADELLAFNYGRRESQLDFLTAAEVADAVGGRDGISLLAPNERPLDQVLCERDAGHRLWRLCLIVALAALAAEVLLLKLRK